MKFYNKAPSEIPKKKVEKYAVAVRILVKEFSQGTVTILISVAKQHSVMRFGCEGSFSLFI